MAILPLNIEFKDWAAQIRNDLPNKSFPLPPAKAEDWRGWACRVVNSNNIQGVPLPTELGYPNDEDWKKWAAYFINSVYS